jgi:hypothetical protein
MGEVAVAPERKVKPVTGRQHCARCGRWKLSVEFRWKAAKSGPPTGNGVHKELVGDQWYIWPYIDSVCIECRNKAGKLRDRSRSKARQLARVYDSIEHMTYEKKAKYLEKRIRNVRSVMPHIIRQYYGEERLVPLMPFRLWLIRSIHRGGGNLKAFAEIVQRDESQIRRWAEGIYWEGECNPAPIHSITLRNVDEVLTMAGESPDKINELYPWEDFGENEADD